LSNLSAAAVSPAAFEKFPNIVYPGIISKNTQPGTLAASPIYFSDYSMT